MAMINPSPAYYLNVNGYIRTARQGDKYLFLMACSSGNVAYYCVARMNPDGSMDTSFGNSSIVQLTSMGTSGPRSLDPRRLLIDQDGKILVAGSCNQGGQYAFCFSRLNADGSPDTTFGTSGTVISAFTGDTTGLGDVTILSDGKLVAAGLCDGICVARYLPNGSFDTAFGVNGWFRQSVGFTSTDVNGVHVYADGKILVMGKGRANGVLMVRFQPNGAFDTSFNTTG